MLLGVPAVSRREGYIEFNAHRVYGYERLAYVALGFELLGFADGCTSVAEECPQRTVLLRKPLKGEAAALLAEDFAGAAERPLLTPCKYD